MTCLSLSSILIMCLSVLAIFVYIGNIRLYRQYSSIWAIFVYIGIGIGNIRELPASIGHSHE